MLQLGEQDKTLSRPSSDGFARQNPVTTVNKREEIGQDMNAEAGNAAVQPDQPDLDGPGRRRQLMV